MIRYQGLTDYDSIFAVSPRSWGYYGKDTSAVDGGDFTGVTVTDDFETVINSCDAVLLDIDDRLPAASYASKIELCKRLGKHMISHKYACRSASCSGDEGNEQSGFENAKSVDDINKRLYTINTPVICIYGLGERCNKFDIQLSLRKLFMNEGYRVSQLGSKWYSNVCGFSSLPEFLFDDHSYENKIFWLNSYVKRIVTDEDPDIMIIGVPGGIMPMTNHTVNHFGELSGVISMAVRPDINVLSIYASEYSDAALLNITDILKYKSGCPVEYINMANTTPILDVDSTPDVSYLTIDNNTCQKILEASPISDKSYFFNVLCEDSCRNVYKNIIENLINNFGVLC